MGRFRLVFIILFLILLVMGIVALGQHLYKPSPRFKPSDLSPEAEEWLEEIEGWRERR